MIQVSSSGIYQTAILLYAAELMINKYYQRCEAKTEQKTSTRYSCALK